MAIDAHMDGWEQFDKDAYMKRSHGLTFFVRKYGLSSVSLPDGTTLHIWANYEQTPDEALGKILREVQAHGNRVCAAVAAAITDSLPVLEREQAGRWDYYRAELLGEKSDQAS